MAEIRCMPLKRLTDGPLFGTEPGTLSVLTNMRLQPGGYAEARGGFDKLKPSGGTNADSIGAGAYSDAIQISTSYGWIRTRTAALAFSKNLQLDPGGWIAFPTTAVDDAVYFGADLPFSRIMMSIGVVATFVSATFVYEHWNGASWSGLTTAETIDFTVLRTPQFASWTLPINWTASTEGDATNGRVLKYWMRIRVSAQNTLVSPQIALAQGFWIGMRELYIASQNPTGGAAVGLLRRHGQNGTTEEWFSVNSALFSANVSPTRFAAYRGRVILVNGKETKRWDGANFVDLGCAAPSGTLTLLNVAGGVMGAGTWRYYVAVGYGPCQNTDAYADRQDAKSLYGPGRAVFVPGPGANQNVITAAGQRVRIESSIIPDLNVSSLYIYRTQDLTGIPASDHPNFPAYLIQSLRVNGGLFEQNLGVVGNYYYDDNRAAAFPPIEAVTYDNSPPPRCKHISVYQNRLFLADDDTVYWSDPFTPDLFSTKSTTGFMRLTKATGGRHMGMIEFADQLVAFTEDQTWGITNVDLDVPQLYPIGLGVGCIAPDAAAAGDGVVIWPARDGFYLWDGSAGGPRKISNDLDTALSKLSYENHGGSRAIIRNRVYTVQLASADFSSMGTSYEFNLETGTWNVLSPSGITSTIAPLTVIHAPLGNADAGGVHGLWGKIAPSAGSDFSLYIDDWTTQDNASNYICIVTMHFPMGPSEMLAPRRVVSYYQASDGWQTPVLSWVGGTSPIGSNPGTLNTGTADSGADYSAIAGTFSQQSATTSDLKVQFSVTTQAGGTVFAQRFFGAVMEGGAKGIRRGLL